jgi:hypothetical protein
MALAATKGNESEWPTVRFCLLALTERTVCWRARTEAPSVPRPQGSDHQLSQLTENHRSLALAALTGHRPGPGFRLRSRLSTERWHEQKTFTDSLALVARSRFGAISMIGAATERERLTSRNLRRTEGNEGTTDQ